MKGAGIPRVQEPPARGSFASNALILGSVAPLATIEIKAEIDFTPPRRCN